MLWGREVIFFAGKEAACEALTDGVAENMLALMFVYTMWSIAARYDIAMWTERAPSKRNPADLPPRSLELPFYAEPGQEPPPLAEIYDFCELPWMLQP